MQERNKDFFSWMLVYSSTGTALSIVILLEEIELVVAEN